MWQRPTVSAVDYFDILDANKDGLINRAEANSPLFDKYDLDGNGAITKAEWINYLNQQAILQLDTNGDGKVDWQE